jgi:hypothetical protein
MSVLGEKKKDGMRPDFDKFIHIDFNNAVAPGCRV